MGVTSPLPTRWIATAAIAAILCGLGGLALPLTSTGADDAPPAAGPFKNIHVIDFDGPIMTMMGVYMKRRLEAAEADGADCIVLRIESPGGRVDISKDIGDLLLALPDSIHTIAWVPNHAISGAAFISLACRELILTPHASIGDSQPILGGATGKPEPVGEKMESPLRAWFTAYAEENDYPVLLAQAMVSAHMEVLQVRSTQDASLHYVRGKDWREAKDTDQIIDGYPKSDFVQVGPAVVREGELFTITGRQAKAYGFVVRSFDGGQPREEAEVLAALSAPGATVTQTKMSFSEKASRVLLTISGILSAFVVLSVTLLIFQGPGLMSIIGGIALVLVILINLTADQLNGFPIFLILLGVALMAAEVFVLPGFGVAGILGIASMGAGFLFLASGSTLGDTGHMDGDLIVSFGLQFVATVIAGFATLLVLSRWFPMVGPAKGMILQPSGLSHSGASSSGPSPSGAALDFKAGADMPNLGARGLTQSNLRPSGSAEFEGRLVDVVSDGPFVPAGTEVLVIQVEGERVTVRPTSDAAPDSPGSSSEDAS